MLDSSVELDAMLSETVFVKSCHSGFGRARKQVKAGEGSETVRRLG